MKVPPRIFQYTPRLYHFAKKRLANKLSLSSSVLSAVDYPDTKLPGFGKGSCPDALNQSTLWLRDDLLKKNVFAASSENMIDKVDRHLYVNGLSDAAVPPPTARVGPAVGPYASARVVAGPQTGSLPTVEAPMGGSSPRAKHGRSLGSARMARRLHSLGMQVRRADLLL